MVRILQFDESYINKYRFAFSFIANEVGVVDGLYYILYIDNKEKLLYRYDDVFAIFEIDDDNDYCVDMFSIDENYNISKLGTENYEVSFSGDISIFFERSNSHTHMVTMGKKEEDVDGYNGYISYMQYSPENDMQSLLIYQYMYRENSKLYNSYLLSPFQVVIDKHTSKIPIRKNYISRKFSSDEYVSDFMNIKEYGLTNFLSNNNYSLCEGDKRYYISKFKLNGYAITLFPFCRQYKLDELSDYLENIGHNTEIPEFIKDFYNGDYPKLNEFSEVAKFMKNIELNVNESLKFTHKRGEVNDKNN